MVDKKRPHICKFCKKGFSSEMVLSSHLCVKKKRYADRNTIGSRMGFRIFQLFYKKNTTAKKDKTVEDFINNKFYMSFVKFGRYYADLNPVHGEQFINFLMDNSIKMKYWTRPEIYEEYIEQIVYKEAASNAIERTIITMVNWSEESRHPYYEFFNKATPSEITKYIKNGRISPWAIYLCKSGSNVFSRLSSEQAVIIKDLIDPDRWTAKLLKDKEAVNFYKKVLSESGL
jgi:hypothetical protein